MNGPFKSPADGHTSIKLKRKGQFYVGTCEYGHFILVLGEMKSSSDDWTVTTSDPLPSEHAQTPTPYLTPLFLVTKQLLHSRHMGLGFRVVSS